MTPLGWHCDVGRQPAEYRRPASVIQANKEESNVVSAFLSLIRQTKWIEI